MTTTLDGGPRHSYLLDPRQIRFLEAPSVILRHEAEVCGYLQSAQESIRIFSGEANCLVYSRPAVLKSLREACARGVRIEMSLGPSISIWDSDDTPGLFELVHDGTVRLFVRSTRGKEGHYFLRDDQQAWIQDYHSALAPLASRDSHEITDASKLQELVEGFEIAKDDAVDSVAEPEVMLVRMTPVQIQWIRERGHDFDILDREALRQELEAFDAAETRATKAAERIVQELARRDS